MGKSRSSGGPISDRTVGSNIYPKTDESLKYSYLITSHMKDTDYIKWRILRTLLVGVKTDTFIKREIRSTHHKRSHLYGGRHVGKTTTTRQPKEVEDREHSFWWDLQNSYCTPPTHESKRISINPHPNDQVDMKQNKDFITLETIKKVKEVLWDLREKL